jgi:hypothetical protein
MLGQLPLSQMVWSLLVSTIVRTFLYSGPTGNFTLSQSGRFLRSEVITGSSIIVFSLSVIGYREGVAVAPAPAVIRHNFLQIADND